MLSTCAKLKSRLAQARKIAGALFSDKISKRSAPLAVLKTKERGIFYEIR